MKKNTRKKGNKKHDKKKRHTRRKIGGTPTKLTLPTTYLAIDREMMVNGEFDPLNEWVHENRQLCDCVANGISKTVCRTTQASDWVLQEDQQLILVIEFQTLQRLHFSNLNMNENFETIKKDILGFAIIQTPPGGNTLAIYDVCLTKEVRGKGKLLFSIIMTYIELTFGRYDIQIWLGVKINNVNFDKVCNVYTSYGFSNPFITQTDVFGVNMGFAFLSLNKHISYFVNDEATTKITLDKCLYMKNSYDINEAGAVNLRFSENCLNKLRLFPFLTEGGIEPLQETNSPYESHHEYSGSFIITDHFYHPNTNYLQYKLAFETISPGREIDYKIGEQESVNVKHDSFSFHSHPIALYKNYNVLIAPPSGPDFRAFLQSLTPYEFSADNDAETYTRSPGQCHFVVTVEGIYCISLHENFIKNFLTQFSGNNLDGLYDVVAYNMDYDFNERQFDWNNILETDEAIENLQTTEELDQAIDKYKEFFHNQNNNRFYDNNGTNIGPIFEMEIYTWKQLFDRNNFPGFSINYPKIHGNYFMPSSEYKILSQMFVPSWLSVKENGGYNSNNNNRVPTGDAGGVPTGDAGGVPTGDAGGVPTDDTNSVPTNNTNTSVAMDIAENEI